MLNYHWITDKIALGEEPLLEHLSFLKEQKIQHILDLRLEVQIDAFVQEEAKKEFDYKNIPIEDGKPVSLDQISSCIDFVLINTLHSFVYVHCQRGISRSPMILMCYFIKIGYNGFAAHNLIKSKRKRIWININFLESIESFERKIIEENKRKRAVDIKAYEMIRNQSYYKLSEFIKRLLKKNPYLIQSKGNTVDLDLVYVDLDLVYKVLLTRYEFRTWINKDSIIEMMNRVKDCNLQEENGKIIYIS